MQSHECSFFRLPENLGHVHVLISCSTIMNQSLLKVVSWVSCMSHRRTCPQTRSMGGKSNNIMSPGWLVPTSWLPTALWRPVQKLKQWTLQSCLIQPRNERETLTRKGWSHCTTCPFTKYSYIQGLTYSSFSFSRYEGGCTCCSSFFAFFKTNTFPTTFNFQSCNRYRELLCPSCWLWHTTRWCQNRRKLRGKKWVRFTASGINEQISFQTLQKKNNYQTFSKTFELLL